LKFLIDLGLGKLFSSQYQDLAMNNLNLSPPQANLKLALWNAEAEALTGSELYVQLQGLRLPEEIVSRLHELITLTQKVAGKVFAVGKIVLVKILEFVQAHPLLVLGMGIGAVIGTAIASLIISIPFLGTFLAPIAAVLQTTFTTIGVISGHRLDKQFQGIGNDITNIVQQFFSFFVNVFNTVFHSIVTA
jgi:ABC-type nitrate/sulfonate/bicarbonate transport system permease component